jgi:hypothetical protein
LQHRDNWNFEMKKAKAKSKIIKKRGGRRPGAGRKPKPRAPAIPLRVVSSDVSAQDLAKAYLALAIEVLASIAGDGASEAARVAAAKGIVEIAGGAKPRAAQGTADPQRHDDEQDGWGDLLRPANRAH